jgi:hypothetical protein
LGDIDLLVLHLIPTVSRCCCPARRSRQFLIIWLGRQRVACGCHVVVSALRPPCRCGYSGEVGKRPVGMVVDRRTECLRSPGLQPVPVRRRGGLWRSGRAQGVRACGSSDGDRGDPRRHLQPSWPGGLEACRAASPHTAGGCSTDRLGRSLSVGWRIGGQWRRTVRSDRPIFAAISAGCMAGSRRCQ